jgi:hypothetical protein
MDNLDTQLWRYLVVPEDVRLITTEPLLPLGKDVDY